MNVYQLNNGDLDVLVEGKVENGLKCGTFGASAIENRHLATGDHKGKLAIYDLENIATPIYSAQAHSSIINCIDGVGGME
ncbi:WD40 repeat domain-containing protein, partial [archaeon]